MSIEMPYKVNFASMAEGEMLLETKNCMLLSNAAGVKFKSERFIKIVKTTNKCNILYDFCVAGWKAVCVCCRAILPVKPHLRTHLKYT